MDEILTASGERSSRVLEFRQHVFERFRQRSNIPPLTGAPAAPREKTYSAQSGFVYRYTYSGQRAASRQGFAGTEYVFKTSPDAKTSFPVSVFVLAEAVESWEGGHARTLTATERYAVAKMALFQAFDERLDPGEMRQEVWVRATDIEAILETLDID